MNRLVAIWKTHRLVAIGFLLAALLTIGFAIKTIGGILYWSQHRNAEIEPWMTIGYIAHSYRISPRDLGEALDLTRDQASQKPVGDLAKDAGISFELLRDNILLIIDAQKSSND